MDSGLFFEAFVPITGAQKRLIFFWNNFENVEISSNARLTVEPSTDSEPNGSLSDLIFPRHDLMQPQRNNTLHYTKLHYTENENEKENENENENRTCAHLAQLKSYTAC